MNTICDNPYKYLDIEYFYKLKEVIYSRMFYYVLEGFSGIVFYPLSCNIATVTLAN